MEKDDGGVREVDRGGKKGEVVARVLPSLAVLECEMILISGWF